MVRLAGRTRETMAQFLERATQQKIDRMSALITESFRFLLRNEADRHYYEIIQPFMARASAGIVCHVRIMA